MAAGDRLTKDERERHTRKGVEKSAGRQDGRRKSRKKRGRQG